MTRIKYQTLFAKLLLCLTIASLIIVFENNAYAQQTLKKSLSKEVTNAARWYEKEIATGPNDQYFTDQNHPLWELSVQTKQKNGSLLKIPVYQKDMLNRVMYVTLIKGNYTGFIKEFYKKNKENIEVSTYSVKGKMLEDGHINKGGEYQIDWNPQLNTIKNKAIKSADPNAYVSDYVYTAHDKEVLRRVDTEMDDSDESNNINCHGRNAVGNKPFRGTLEYLLIKLAYLTSGSGNREVDFQVDSPKDFKHTGYIDLADRYTHEMFIIKPDEPKQIQTGKAELASYVTTVRQSCGAEWHIGTVFKSITMPNGKGANLTARLVPGTGVIVYTLQNKNIK